MTKEKLPPAPGCIETAWRAIELVHERRKRVTAALERAGLEYAVIGGLAVWAWVETADSGAVRGTPNVDVLVRRADFASVAHVLGEAGFVQAPSDVGSNFLDGPQGNVRSAIQVWFSGEKILEKYLIAAPELTESRTLDGFRVIDLEALVRMKVTAFRLVDKVHLRDLMDVGVVDATWPACFPPELATRLQAILDDPYG